MIPVLLNLRNESLTCINIFTGIFLALGEFPPVYKTSTALYTHFEQAFSHQFSSHTRSLPFALGLDPWNVQV